MVKISNEGYNVLIAKSEANFSSVKFPTLEHISDRVESYLKETHEQDLTFAYNGKVVLRPTFLVSTSVCGDSIYMNLYVNDMPCLKGVKLIKTQSLELMADTIAESMIIWRADRAVEESVAAIQEAMILSFEADWQEEVYQLIKSVKYNPEVAEGSFSLSIDFITTSEKLTEVVDEALSCCEIDYREEKPELSSKVYKQGEDLFVELFNHGTATGVTSFLVRESMLNHFTEDHLLETISGLVENIVQDNIRFIQIAMDEHSDEQSRKSREEQDYISDIVNYRQ